MDFPEEASRRCKTLYREFGRLLTQQAPLCSMARRVGGMGRRDRLAHEVRATLAHSRQAMVLTSCSAPIPLASSTGEGKLGQLAAYVVEALGWHAEQTDRGTASETPTIGNSCSASFNKIAAVLIALRTASHARADQL